MDVSKESYLLHSKAWTEYDKSKAYLKSAFEILMGAYKNGEQSNVVVNNLAAVLLDLYRDDEALHLLKNHKPECSEYCLNYAIALAKQNIADVNEVRKWNKLAASYPKQNHAITAYIDWQAL